MENNKDKAARVFSPPDGSTGPRFCLLGGTNLNLISSKYGSSGFTVSRNA